MTNSWLQIHFPTAQDTADTISDSLTDLGALAVTLNAGDEKPIFQLQPGDMPLWDAVVITALFTPDTDPTWVKQSLIDDQCILKTTPWRDEILQEQDWVAETQRQFPSRCFGDHLWVVPCWEDNPDSDTVVRIDPGLAFGTGSHETTALCLEWIARQRFDNQTVIDYGCGSGILALAAAQQGASVVYAIDHDEQACLATTQNQALNPSLTTTLHIGDESRLPMDCEASVVIANILAGPLKSLYPKLANHTAVGGTLVLSGLLQEDVPELIACYEAQFQHQDTTTDGDWARLVFQKR